MERLRVLLTHSVTHSYSDTYTRKTTHTAEWRRSQRARLTMTRTNTDTFAPARLTRARTLTRLYHFIFLGRDKNCILYPEGGDLCRGSFGSVEIRALSVDHDGEPFFNFKITDEVKEKLPLLPGRIRSFTKFKVSGCSMQLLSDECVRVPVTECVPAITDCTILCVTDTCTHITGRSTSL